MKTSKLRNLEEDSEVQEQNFSSSDTSHLVGLLNNLNKKLSERDQVSDTLDLLVYKVEKIEDSQDKILIQLNELNTTLYEPDSGIFARLKDNTKDLKLIEETSTEEKKNFQELKREVDMLAELQRSSDNNIKELIRWKGNFSTAFKWISASILGPSLGLLLKFFYDQLVNK